MSLGSLLADMDCEANGCDGKFCVTVVVIGQVEIRPMIEANKITIIVQDGNHCRTMVTMESIRLKTKLMDR